jgi:hypothetical protein
MHAASRLSGTLSEKSVMIREIPAQASSASNPHIDLARHPQGAAGQNNCRLGNKEATRKSSQNRQSTRPTSDNFTN